MSSRRVYQLLENEEDDDERWGEARRLIEGLRPDQIDEGHESFNDVGFLLSFSTQFEYRCEVQTDDESPFEHI